MANAVFLKLEGIKGEATDSEHADEIDVISWSWGMAQTGSGHQGKGATAGRVEINDLTINKYMDKSSANLVKHCCLGKPIPKATLTVQRAGEKKVKALQLELEHVTITNYLPNGSGTPGDEIPMESLGLKFKKFKFKYTPQLEDGTADAEIEQLWNVETNEAA